MMHYRDGANGIDVEFLVAAYCEGAFPMARGRGSRQVQWFRPDPRGIIPLEGFHVPRSLKRVLGKGVFEVRHDTAFKRVMERCAEPRDYEAETWINDELIEAYTRLHEMGLAHSIEAWREEELVGGLYGVALGGAFFGESMFHDAEKGSEASKVCLAKTVEHLRRRGFVLFDVQFSSAFLERFGAVEISNERYLERLDEALEMEVRWC